MKPICRFHSGFSPSTSSLEFLRFVDKMRQLSVLIGILLISACFGQQGPEAEPSSNFFQSILAWFGFGSNQPPPTLQPEKCSDVGTCQFDNGVDLQFLQSCNGKCVCFATHMVQDKASWDVFWDGKACNIAEYGPCGISSDSRMLMGCQPGLECVQKRCRTSAKLGQTPRGQSCYDDVDCQQGSVCKQHGVNVLATRNCVDPADDLSGGAADGLPVGSAKREPEMKPLPTL